MICEVDGDKTKEGEILYAQDLDNYAASVKRLENDMDHAPAHDFWYAKGNVHIRTSLVIDSALITQQTNENCVEHGCNQQVDSKQHESDYNLASQLAEGESNSLLIHGSMH